jgi:LacI family xylobiose transport system transcriptional regulator
MAEAAARLVLDLGRGERPSAATRVELATSLVVRSSTAAPAGEGRAAYFGAR